MSVIVMGGYNSLSMAPSIPPGGREGDILMVRNGELTWVSPREGLQLSVEMKIGDPFAKETMEDGIFLKSRGSEEPHVPPIVEVSGYKKPAPVNAWTKILEGFIEVAFDELKVGDSIEWYDHFREWGYPNTLHDTRTLGGVLKLVEPTPRWGWGIRVVIDMAPEEDPIKIGDEVFRWSEQMKCIRRA